MTPVSELSRLQSLSLEDNFLENIDIEPLGVCVNLQDLGLNKNRLQRINLSPLSSCHNLRKLTLNENQIADINLEPLNTCISLQTLLLDSNLIEHINLQPLISFEKLDTLSLGFNKIHTIDLSPLANCKVLRKLSLEGNLLQDIDLGPLSSCKNLQVLILNGNQLKDVDLSPLTSCTKLEVLEITNNNLDNIDLNPLSFCMNLRRLDVSNNQLHGIDVSPLKDIRYFQYLLASNNAIELIDLNSCRKWLHLDTIDLRKNKLLIFDYAPLKMVWHHKISILLDDDVQKINRRWMWSSEEIFKGEGLVDTRMLLKDEVIRRLNQYLRQTFKEVGPVVLVHESDKSVEWEKGELHVQATINPEAQEFVLTKRDDDSLMLNYSLLTTRFDDIFMNSVAYVTVDDPGDYHNVIPTFCLSHIEGKVQASPIILYKFVFSEEYNFAAEKRTDRPSNRMGEVSIPSTEQATLFLRRTLEAAHRLLSQIPDLEWVIVSDDYLTIRYLIHHAGLSLCQPVRSTEVIENVGQVYHSPSTIPKKRTPFVERFREVMKEQLGQDQIMNDITWENDGKSYSFHIEIVNGASHLFELRCSVI